MPYQQEFPEYDPATMPALPEGWLDTSWRNDACPSYQNEALRLQVWIDFEKPEDRAYGDEIKRFGLYNITEDGCIEDDTAIIATDDWEEVLAAVKRHAEAS
jgi:hypothetical protein